MTNVFVYGTLKRGCKNHALLRGQTFIKEDQITGRMLHLIGFPAVYQDKEAKNNYPIQGEIFSVSEQALEALDRLEGHPRFYRREVTKTKGGEDVWAYFLKPDGNYEELTNGLWRE